MNTELAGKNRDIALALEEKVFDLRHAIHAIRWHTQQGIAGGQQQTALEHIQQICDRAISGS